MSNITSMKELNTNLKRVIYNEIESYAKQSRQSVRCMDLTDNLKIKMRDDGMVSLDFSVSAVIEDEKQ